jgi:hypothetical protein
MAFTRSWPFVGRDEELAWVAAVRREDVLPGVVLSGAARVGKTRLDHRAGVRARPVAGSMNFRDHPEYLRSLTFDGKAPEIDAETGFDVDPQGIPHRPSHRRPPRARR